MCLCVRERMGGEVTLSDKPSERCTAPPALHMRTTMHALHIHQSINSKESAHRWQGVCAVACIPHKPARMQTH